jgi:hypothetical protein
MIEYQQSIIIHQSGRILVMGGQIQMTANRRGSREAVQRILAVWPCSIAPNKANFPVFRPKTRVGCYKRSQSKPIRGCCESGDRYNPLRGTLRLRSGRARQNAGQSPFSLEFETKAKIERFKRTECAKQSQFRCFRAGNAGWAEKQSQSKPICRRRGGSAAFFGRGG